MDSRDFAKGLHAMKCNSILSSFKSETNAPKTNIVKALEIDPLKAIKHRNDINSFAIRSNISEEKQNLGVVMEEAAFSKAVGDMDLIVHTNESLSAFKRDAQSLQSKGKMKQSDLKKAFDDIKKLVKTTVVDPKGKQTTYYVAKREVVKS